MQPRENSFAWSDGALRFLVLVILYIENIIFDLKLFWKVLFWKVLLMGLYLLSKKLNKDCLKIIYQFMYPTKKQMVNRT